MRENELLTRRMLESSALSDRLAAGRDAFEFIQQIASVHTDGPRRYAFALAVAAACRGRNALGGAPSLPGEPGAGEQPPACVLADPSLVARELAVLAAVAERQLADACSAASCWDDQEACEHAVLAAREVRELLDGGA